MNVKWLSDVNTNVNWLPVVAQERELLGFVHSEVLRVRILNVW